MKISLLPTFTLVMASFLAGCSNYKTVEEGPNVIKVSVGAVSLTGAGEGLNLKQPLKVSAVNIFAPKSGQPIAQVGVKLTTWTSGKGGFHNTDNFVAKYVIDNNMENVIRGALKDRFEIDSTSKYSVFISTRVSIDSGITGEQRQQKHWVMLTTTNTKSVIMSGDQKVYETHKEAFSRDKFSTGAATLFPDPSEMAVGVNKSLEQSLSASLTELERNWPE